MEFTFGSLFSGIGGIDLGLERAGMTCRWQVEIDEFCQKVLQKHWPNVSKYRDVRDCGRHNLETVDLICGGFPCQPVSVAGKRKGQKDERWLWPEFARILGELKPRWVLVENVPGLRSVSGGTAFAEVLQDLARHGYDAEWANIPAAAIGAPHLRYRVFIVAYCNTAGLEGHGRPQQSARELTAPTSSILGRARDVADSKSGSSHECNITRRIFEVEQTQVRGLCGSGRQNQWAVEPDVGRVAHGIPSRVDRLKSLGNAVVPQVAEWVGRRIVEANA